MSKKPVLLCIMDGFGWTPNETYGNAVVAAKKPFLDSLMAKYPMTTIEASGMAVGLPDGQMGNSEVGHTNMGAGRIVYQQLTLITKSIRDGEMLKNPVLVKNMKAAIDAGKAIHLMGLVGTGGVHSHADHWFGVLEMAKRMGAKEVYLHCITDGRDTDPHSGKGFLADLQAKLDELGIGKLASVSGRYCAMDRDNNWDREEKAFAAFVYGEGNHAANAAEAIEASSAAAPPADGLAGQGKAQFFFGVLHKPQRLGVGKPHLRRCAAQRAGLLDQMEQAAGPLAKKALACVIAEHHAQSRFHGITSQRQQGKTASAPAVGHG